MKIHCNMNFKVQVIA